jgi:hypothetical protein
MPGQFIHPRYDVSYHAMCPCWRWRGHWRPRGGPAVTGTLPTTGGLWVGLLVGLTYLPALALGPVAEHVAMLRGAAF